MDNGILELAIEALENRKAAIDIEIAKLRGKTPAASPHAVAQARSKPRRKRTAAQRKAQSVKMKKIWAAKRKANRS